MRALRRFTVRPVLPDALAPLSELATNLRWSWHPGTQDLFARADPDAWEKSGRDPVRVLGALSRERLAELAHDVDYLAEMTRQHEDLQAYLTSDRWYQRAIAAADAPAAIAYFSPEYGITSVLPQYSGGLGILAGDHLKTASDLGVPLVGVGLLYRSGYFRQSLSFEGWQRETYPVLDPHGLPLSLLREDDGSRVLIGIDLPDNQRLLAQLWVAQVGRVPLLLLDADVDENGALRDVTDRLYGGSAEHRLRQEILLGIGGVRALRAWSRLTGAPAPEVFHTNEGHAGFLGLERIRELSVADDGPHQDLQAALEQTRAGTVFTTHTPVPAGIDRFSRDLVAQYFGGSSPVPGVPVDWVLSLGEESYPGGDPGVFNMAVMGFRLAQRANGVSALHGHVSREMFTGLWPGFDESEVPITSITNGVHPGTWVAREVFALAEAVGADPDQPDIWNAVDQVDAAALWQTKWKLRATLIADARARLRKSWQQRGATPAELGWVDEVLDPNVLTIGFARRVPSYKRLTLMLRDPERLRRLLLDPERPVQLVIAGKSHPADDGGKKLIQELVRFADQADVRHRIVFLPNYDIAMAQPLYPGCDVWLNNPLRPYEACGTSGMKAALNGGLNLSILDGWWDEWYDGNNGWAIPSADGVDDTDRRDEIEAQALYDLIENEVAPRFYDHDEHGLPMRWIEMVRHTLKSLGPKVVSGRMVAEYVERLYVPAGASERAMAVPGVAASSAAWKAKVRAAWPEIRVEYADTNEVDDNPEVGHEFDVQAYVFLGGLQPEDVVVQIVGGAVRGEDELVDTYTIDMAAAEALEPGRYRFRGRVSLEASGPFGFTVRVLPRHATLASSAELGLVALPQQPL